ncbi:TPA: peptidase domain-containing ABC transporter [Stenotrophomonas maltophilia]
MIARNRVPVVLQDEIADCGMACISMALQYHGIRIGPRELRNRHGSHSRGMRLNEIIDILGAYAVEADAYSVSGDEVHQLAAPSILHWENSHFVVLDRIAKQHFDVVDPKRGRQKLSAEEFFSRFSGVALEVRAPRCIAKPVSERGLSLLDFAKSIEGMGLAALLLVALSLSMNLAIMASPLLMQWLIDDVAISKDQRLLVIAIGVMGFSSLFQILAGTVRSFTLLTIMNTVSRQWSKGIFVKILSKKWTFVQNRSLGDIASRVSSLTAVQKAISNGVVEALLDGVLGVFTLLILLFYSWRLAAITLLFIALYSVLKHLAVAPVKNLSEVQLKAAAAQQSFILQSIKGFTSIKANGVEQWSRRSYGTLVDQAASAEFRVGRASIIYGLVSQLPLAVDRLVIIALGVLLVFDNKFTVGMLIAYISYKDQFGARTQSLIDKIAELRTIHVHVDRVTPLVSDEGEGPSELGEIAGEIESLVFRNVGYYYNRSSNVVMSCNIEIRRGDFVAIVGESGAGKSTLLKLAMALIEPTEGSILVNGIDLARINKTSYAGQIGSVLQEDTLFSGTLLENIALGDQDPDISRVHLVASAMCIHSEIVAMPSGYRTIVGDLSDGLSGGQRQRILLARALYRKPTILLLDEATSDLDVANERRVSAALKDAGITTLFVAHRPEAIKSANAVIELKDGHVRYLPNNSSTSSLAMPQVS